MPRRKEITQPSQDWGTDISLDLNWISGEYGTSEKGMWCSAEAVILQPETNCVVGSVHIRDNAYAIQGEISAQERRELEGYLESLNMIKRKHCERV